MLYCNNQESMSAVARLYPSVSVRSFFDNLQSNLLRRKRVMAIINVSTGSSFLFFGAARDRGV